MKRRSQHVSFTGSQGASLDARLEVPTREPIAYAVFAHCFTCTKDIFPVARISRALAERGIAVLRFDFTGLGASEGDFAATNFTSNVDDLVAAAAFLAAENHAPSVLIGHSLGGSAVLAAAQRIPSVTAVCTINAPSDPAHVRRHLEPGDSEIQERGEAEIAIAGRPFTFRRQFLEDIESHDLRSTIETLDRALLVLHSPDDEVVAVDNGIEIFSAASHPKNFVSLDGADHMLSRRSDAAYAADTIANWAARHVPSRIRPDATEEALPAGTVEVSEVGPGRYTQRIRAGKHESLADEPATHGGDDVGPSPYEFLLAGLGACTSMTLRMYADRKEWPLEGVTVRLTHARIHAADCRDCATKSGHVDEISRVIALTGDLSATQRARLLEIANKCPVHRTLKSEVAVRSSLEDE